MKHNFRLLITMTATCVAIRLSAQDKPVIANEASVRDENEVIQRLALSKTLENGTEVLGMEIKDRQNHKLGKVKDLAIDLENGRIVEVIVTTGGFLGIDSKLAALPPELFLLDAADKSLRLNVDPQQIKNAPEFEMSKWAQNVENLSVAEVYQRYEVKPYFDTDPAAKKPVSPRQEEQLNSTASTRVVHLGYVERLSKVMGMTAKNLQDEKLGKVENVILDLPAGRLVEVILSSGGFLGMGDELSAVPPSAFRFDAGHGVLQLDTTKEALSSAPHFKSTEWPVNQPDYIVGVYRSYRVEPYFSANNVDNTAQNKRDRDNDTMTPFKQGDSKEDVQITRDIRKQILARHDLSVNAQNVKIITLNARVTLRGVVNSEEEKHLIVDIAKSTAVHAAEVVDQMEVQGTSPATSSIK